MRNLLIIICLSLATLSWSQKNVFLNLEPLFGSQAFDLNQTFVGNDGIAIEIDHFNYYLSEVKLFHDNGLQTNLDSDIWLVTPEQTSLYLGYINLNQIDSINFTVGVPKFYNTQAGALAQDISAYPDTHPLSFQSPSMYWGWAFGYMHMIIGGMADNNNDNIPNAYFELHNLGNNNQQNIALPCIQTNIGSQIDLNYICHVDRWLQQIPLANIGVVHGEAGLNQQILQNVNSQDVFSLSANANLTEHPADLVSWIQNENEGILAAINDLMLKNYHLYNGAGQQFMTEVLNSATARIALEQLPTGLYLLKVEMNNGSSHAFRFVKP